MNPSYNNYIAGTTMLFYLGLYSLWLLPTARPCFYVVRYSQRSTGRYWSWPTVHIRRKMPSQRVPFGSSFRRPSTRPDDTRTSSYMYINMQHTTLCIASANLIYPIYILLRRNKATKTSTECILDHQKVSTFSNPIYSYHKLTIFVLYIKLQILSSTG